MFPSKTTDALNNRVSRYRPKSKNMDADDIGILRILIIGFLFFIIIVPTTLNYEPTTNAVLQMEEQHDLAQTESLLHYSLPEDNMKITEGSLLGYHGFAYASNITKKVYFVDLIQNAYLEQDFPSGVATTTSILTVDYDIDGNDEFVLHNDVGGVDYAVIVDFNDAKTSVVQLPGDITSPIFRGVGDFNGDAYQDLLICHNGYIKYYTIDLYNNATIGSFNTVWGYYATIGRFEASTHDSIAIVDRYYYSPPSYYSHRNITIVDGDGTWLRDTMLVSTVTGITTFDYLGGVQDLAIIDSVGYVAVYSGNTLSQAYRQPVVLTSVSSIYIDTGIIDMDAQEDIVIVDRNSEKAYFVNGSSGLVISETEEVFAGAMKRFDLGYLDQDSYTDLVVPHTSGGLALVRGVDGVMAYIENLIDLRAPGLAQILTLDVNSNGRDDTLCQIASDVYLKLSDVTPPETIVMPISPLHPTILDDYVTVRVNVVETSSVEHIDLWIRLPGSSLWIQPQDEMYASHQEGLYYAFIGNLQPGVYQYYITVQDSYLNMGNLGNSTHPLSFIVSGDFVWKIDKTETDYVHKIFHQSDIGNLSDGSRVIYTIERPMGVEDLSLIKYSSSGTILDSLNVTIPSGDRFDNFEVYTAMLDGDNVLDIIVLDYYYDGALKTSLFRYHAYHGDTFSLMGEGVVPYPYKSFTFIEVFDDDGDGNEELLLVSETYPESILKMDSDLIWSSLEFPEQIGVRGFSVIRGSPFGYIAVIRGSTRIDIYTTDLSFSHSLGIDMSGYSNMEPIGITTMYNWTTGEEQFVAGFNYWNATDPTGRIFVFDGTTTNLDNTPVYNLLHRDLTYLYPADVSGDPTDELFLIVSTGELYLTQLGTTLTTSWIAPVTGATPLSALIADFDGDDEDDFLLFTDQDELLTQVSFSGEVKWTVEVGEVHNPMLLGDIDLTPGDEIAAYPFATYTSYSLGAVRNLDSNYLLDVFVEYSSSNIIQGHAFEVNVTVTNIYSEIVEDASVYMSAHFMTSEGPALNTFGFYYADGWAKYHAITDATWPIGVANLSITVDNKFYHPYEKTLVDAIIVQSDLHIQVQSPDLVNQGDAMNVTVWVNDNLGSPVDDATVSITLEGVVLPAIQSGPFYVVNIPELQLEAGSHFISALAIHPHAIGIGVGEKAFEVQILTTSLIVNTDFPASVEQDKRIVAWFNISDPYGFPIEGATVTLKSGPKVFQLMESPVLGCYIFSHNMTLGIGSQTFELNVQKQGIVGPPVLEISFDVFGNLQPNVFFVPRVEGGSDFEITIFVKDKYGPVFDWTSIQVEINGTRYTALPSTIDSAECSMWVPADFLLGPNLFTVYINATYASPWSGQLSIRAYSDAVTSSEIYSSEGWVLTQGDQTLVELFFMDWSHRPISGATVTFFVKALSYNLVESGLGVYSATISTAGWLPGEYEYVISVDHPDVETGDPIVGNITVMGDLEFFVSYSPESPTQGQELIVVISIADGYGNPIPDLEVTIELMGLPPMMAYSTDQIGEYAAIIPRVPTTMGYGDFTLTITAVGEYVGESIDTSTTIPVAPATPDFTMSTSTLSIGAGASFVLSLIGMVIYFRIASSMKVDDKSLEGRKKSIKNMDRLYLLIVLTSAAGLAASYSTYTAGDYSLALILTVALLGCSVLLYGLWLYRDATAAVLVRGSLSRKRMVLGLWHLVFVPVVIYLILLYGVEIDWFKAYIIDQSFTIGMITIPTIMTTIFAAYLSSILVVVVNLYREVSKGLKKIVKMEDAGTPASVVEDEKTSMVSRFSSSVRIKFLMFLVVVGATTVMSMDFLASWELGIIVLLPVAFLVVIPFISSKIIQVFSKMSRGKIPSAPADS